MILLRSHQDEAYPNALKLDEPTQRRIERSQEAITGSLWIETVDAFQAFTHCGNANISQGVGVGQCSGSERYGHGRRRLEAERLGSC